MKGSENILELYKNVSESARKHRINLSHAGSVSQRYRNDKKGYRDLMALIYICGEDDLRKRYNIRVNGGLTR